MTIAPAPHPTHLASESSPWLSRAWTAVALIPVFLVVAIVAGVATLAALGYSSGGDEPLWVALIVDVVVVAILALPCIAAVLFGRRARRAHVGGAIAPIIIGAVAGAGAVILTTVSQIGDALR